MKYIQSILSVTITTVLVYFLFQKIPFESIIFSLQNINSFYFTTSLILLIPDTYLLIKRFLVLVPSNVPLSFKEAISLMFASFSISFVTPSRMGDFSRYFALKKRGLSLKRAAQLGIIEKVVDALTLFSIGIISWMVWKEHYLLAIMTLIFYSVLIGIFFYKSSFRKSNSGSMKIKSILLLTMVFWGCYMIQSYLLLGAVGIAIPLIQALALIALAIVIGFLPISMSGIGTRDAAFLFLFAGYAEPAVIVSYGFLFTFVKFVLPAVIGLFFLPKTIALVKESA